MGRLPIETGRVLNQRGAAELRLIARGLAGHPGTGGGGDEQRALARAAAEDGISLEEAAAYVQGRCDGAAEAWRNQRVEVVWTGPGGVVPVRATAAVLIDVIAAAQRELVLMTYSATPHEAIRQGLAVAVTRGVSVDVVVETLAGAGSALSGAEPATAFRGVPGVKLWHWPKRDRPKESSKMHAKVAIADGTTLLISSANLTQSGVADNLEAGLLVRGGTAPERALEYIRHLQGSGPLRRLAS